MALKKQYLNHIPYNPHSYNFPFTSQSSILLPTVNANPQSKPLFAPIPSVSIDIPASLLIGETVDFTVTFDNTSAADVGYRTIC